MVPTRRASDADDGWQATETVDGGARFLRAGRRAGAVRPNRQIIRHGRSGDVSEHAQPTAKQLGLCPRSPVITETVPDRAPNTTGY